MSAREYLVGNYVGLDFFFSIKICFDHKKWAVILLHQQLVSINIIFLCTDECMIKHINLTDESCSVIPGT